MVEKANDEGKKKEKQKKKQKRNKTIIRKNNTCVFIHSYPIGTFSKQVDLTQ